MLLLDTNVISELRKAKSGKGDRNVANWAAAADPASLFISVVTVMELELGVLQIERRDAAQGAVLRRWLDSHVVPAFEGRVLPIDTPVAQRSAKLQVPDPRPYRDALIAATALIHGMTIVTRNVKDFEAMGLGIIDPWQE